MTVAPLHRSPRCGAVEASNGEREPPGIEQVPYLEHVAVRRVSLQGEEVPRREEPIAVRIGEGERTVREGASRAIRQGDVRQNRTSILREDRPERPVESEFRAPGGHRRRRPPGVRPLRLERHPIRRVSNDWAPAPDPRSGSDHCIRRLQDEPDRSAGPARMTCTPPTYVRAALLKSPTSSRYTFHVFEGTEDGRWTSMRSPESASPFPFPSTNRRVPLDDVPAERESIRSATSNPKNGPPTAPDISRYSRPARVWKRAAESIGPPAGSSGFAPWTGRALSSTTGRMSGRNPSPFSVRIS